MQGAVARFAACLFVLVLAAVAAGCGGGGGEAEQSEAAKTPAAPLTEVQIIDQVRPSTVQISVRVEDEGASGTGVVLDAGAGLILTNYHVVAGSTATSVRWNQTERPATVIAHAPCEDLALVKLAQPIQGLKSITLGSARSLKAGQKVTAIGFPGSLQAEETKLTANTGAVSVDGVVQAEAEDYPRFPEVVQHEVPINPGNSGGPLVDEKAQLVGVNTFSKAGEGVQNQNYSVASDRVKELLPQLKKGDSIAYVGWELISLKGVSDEQLAEQLGWTISTEDIGMFVANVDRGSPAYEAGVRSGDYVEQINGGTVNSVEEVCQIAESNEGNELEVLGYYMKDTPGPEGTIPAGQSWRVNVGVG